MNASNTTYSLTRPIFNVRIYGIMIENDSVLVADEVHAEMMITKFPGGGLQFGESTHECLKREFMEELQIEITILEHFYTVDFFQPSAFDASQQVISIYYLVSGEDVSKIPVKQNKTQYDKTERATHFFRWLNYVDITPKEFTFPIDKKVAELLHQHFTDRKQTLS